MKPTDTKGAGLQSQPAHFSSPGFFARSQNSAEGLWGCPSGLGRAEHDPPQSQASGTVLISISENQPPALMFRSADSGFDDQSTRARLSRARLQVT